MHAPTGPTRHDVLQYLHKGQVTKYDKGKVILDSMPPRLCLVISGRVHVFQTDSGGHNVLLQLVESEGFFGECALWSSAPLAGQLAIAATACEIMSWAATEVEAQIIREPALGIALIEELCTRCANLCDRIFSLGVLPIRPRLIVALQQLGEMIGEEVESGTVRLKGLTHQLLAEFTGASRPIVSRELNRLRSRAAIRYARTHIDLYKDALAAELRAEGRESFWMPVPNTKGLAAGKKPMIERGAVLERPPRTQAQPEPARLFLFGE